MLDIVSLLLPVIILFLIKKWNTPKNSSSKFHLPPGPKPLPIIGNLHLITSLPFRSFIPLSNRYGPIMHLKLGSAPAVVVSSPEIAKQILKLHDPCFANRPHGVAVDIIFYNCVDFVFSPYGDYWRQMRKICINQVLSNKMVRAFVSIRRDEVSRMVETLLRSCGTVVNLTDMIFSFSSSITCRAAFGKVCRDKETLIKLVNETVKMLGGFEIADLFPSSKVVYALSWTRVRAKMMSRKLDLILDDIIDEHSRNLRKNVKDGDSGKWGNSEFGTEDLVDVLLRIKEEENLQFPIGNDNIKAVLYDMFAAATETSSILIDFVMVELMRNPEVMTKVQDEVRRALYRENENTTLFEEEDVQKLEYLKLVIKETLRLHPPAPVIPRVSSEEREINGYTIPANTTVFVNIWGIQRDPLYWKDPEKFHPERFENQTVDFTGGDFRYLPFGSGKRICPGMTYGLTSVEVALAHLLYNFNWKLPKGIEAQNLDMLEVLGLTSPRKDNLFVVATPYQPLR